MAVLTTKERERFRQKVYRLALKHDLPVGFVKAEVDAAFQAVEDHMTSPALAASLNLAINQATSFRFNARQKRAIFSLWLKAAADKEEKGI